MDVLLELEYRGLRLIESDWAKRLGISRCTLRDRLKIYKNFPDIVFFKGRLSGKAKLNIIKEIKSND